MRPPALLALLLLLALGCKDRPVVERPRLDSMWDPVSDTAVSQPDSSALDSAISELIDSLPVTKVETVVTSVPVIDTTPVVRPETTFVIDTTTKPESTVVVTVERKRGIPVGPTQLPADKLGGQFNATILSSARPYDGLATARARKAQVVVYLNRKLTREWNGQDSVLSVAATRKFLATWPDVCPYVKDGTIFSFIASDDITSTEIWGPKAPYHAQIDSIGLLVKQLCPQQKVRTFVRAMPTQVQGYKYQWIDGLWAAYLTAPRMPTVTEYRMRELAEAKRLGKCVVFGINIEFGGDGSSGVPAPRGLRPGAFQMSGAEIVRNAKALLPYTPFFVWYKHDPALEASPAIRAALDTVRAMADTLPRPTCRRS